MPPTQYRSVRLVIGLITFAGIVTATLCAGFAYLYLTSGKSSPFEAIPSFAVAALLGIAAYRPYGFIAECYRMVRDMAINSAETNRLLAALANQQSRPDQAASALSSLRQQAVGEEVDRV